MDSIILLLRKKLQIFNCIENYRETLNGCEVKTKEGIKYTCYVEKNNNSRTYYLYNRYYEKTCKLGIKAIESEFFNDNIIPEIFEDNILKNEILYKAFIMFGIKVVNLQVNFLNQVLYLNNIII